MTLSVAPLLRASASLVALTLAALLFVACGGSSGGPTAPGQGNFAVTNLDNETVHVFVSGSEVGTVGPGATQDFSIDSGFRTVEFRERGDGFRTSHGAYSFNVTSDVRLTYDPGFAFNMRVINTRADTVEVYVGLDYYGDVRPGETIEFRVETGRRDLSFRPRGNSLADYFGTFNFNHTDVVEATVQ